VTINNIDIETTLNKVKTLLKEEKDLSPAVRSMIELLALVITLLCNRLNLSSSNSSKPPSSDPNRKKVAKKKGDRKAGGQKGRVGVTLQKIDNPDEIEFIKLDRRQLPQGDYKEVGYKSRQVFDIDISRVVTEYRAQVLEDSQGKRFVAPFPKGVGKAVQYGMGVKAHSVYMSQFQLIPYNRIEDYFREQLQIPVSVGSLFNFNREAYDLLEIFDEKVKVRLTNSELAHVDETGINIDGDRHWLHSTSNDLWTYFFPHKKRGTDALDTIGILPGFKGTLCHDHWKPYYRYGCTHALCNAHHLRELTRVWEEDGHQWAKKMKELLEKASIAVNNADGLLDSCDAKRYLQKYRAILRNADDECPPPDEAKRKGKRGRIKRTRARNLLERLIEYEDDVLRFMYNQIVPFTNNLCENDIRMTKVQQKISGCFRSMDGAKIFCRIRSYLSTCRKHDVRSSNALNILFRRQLPDFIK
jgi:transposase